MRAECPEQVVVVEDEPESPPTPTTLDEDTPHPSSFFPKLDPHGASFCQHRTTLFLDVEPVAILLLTLPQNTVNRIVNVLCQQYTSLAAQAKQRKRGYFVAVVILAVASDGIQRSISIHGIGARVFRHRFGKKKPTERYGHDGEDDFFHHRLDG